MTEAIVGSTFTNPLKILYFLPNYPTQETAEPIFAISTSKKFAPKWRDF